ncbi:Thymidylate kinase [compost metagenome]
MNKLQVYNLFRKKRELNKGLLITFEGIDGAGKGTHVNQLEKELRSTGYKVKKISFPDYKSPIGEVIASYLQGDYGDVKSVPHELICIAYGADRAKMRDEINSYLNNGYIVLSDRYTYSNLFTAAKMEESKRLPFIEWIEDIEFKEMKVVRPDWNFFLYVDPQISIARTKERGKRDYQNGKEDIHENNSQLLIDTTKTYIDFANSKDNWIIINQMKDKKQIPIDEVFNMIKSHVKTLISEVEKEEL